MKLTDILQEAEYRTKTKQTTTADPFQQPKIDPLQQPKFDAPIASPSQPPDGPKKSPKLKTASRYKGSTATMPPDANKFMNDINASGATDEISDQQARYNSGMMDEPPADTSSMPARISKDMAQYGNIEPEWYQVKTLPGYIQSGIRAIGRQVFSAFTKTPIEDISVIASIGNGGPNTKPEVNAVAGWLQNNGIRDTDAELRFDKVIPGYSADVVVYKAADRTFMLVKDFAGEYVYSWPSSDEEDGIIQQPKLSQQRSKLSHQR
jgi:hypothetical protein